MKVLGIYGSPRKGGNSDQILDRALDGARSQGAEISRVYVRDLEMGGCRECGGCDTTGKCVFQDDMQKVYPLLQEADVIILSSPIFFYGLSSQAKALIDRCQALWSKRMLEKKGQARKGYDSGKGFLIAVGATKGKSLFEGVKLVAKYFYDALDMSYEGGLFYRGLETKRDALERPEALQEAFEFGREVVRSPEITATDS